MPMLACLWPRGVLRLPTAARALLRTEFSGVWAYTPIQAALRDRFGLDVSVSHINRVRAALGLSRRRGAGGKSGGQSAA